MEARDLLVAAGIVIAAAYLLSGVDDVLSDLFFWVTALWRRWKARRYPRLDLEWLEAREQQAVAILVPAWREAGVIGRMLRHTCETLRYRNYEIFVGTYPNDPDTRGEVDEVAARYPRVHNVVASSDGPTTKADNLNQLVAALQRFEAATDRRFEIVVTHDAEDVVHPLSLLVYNYLLPRKDMVQLPVFPAPVPLWQVTHWTYADEFAERHTKELVARERLRGFVPSAGVGTAYSRRALDLLAVRHGGEVFPTQSLTEDYLMGLRVRLEGLRAAFVTQRIALGPGEGKLGRWVATQAMFPRRFRQAVRQKARWILGIALQGWAAAGWPGPWTVRWNLLQDRKVLVTSLVGFLGYVWLLLASAYEVGRWRGLVAGPPVVASGSLLWDLIVGATLVMAWRLVHRALAVARIYGLWAGLSAPPRAVWSNLVNFAAVVSALAQYARIRKARAVVWDKTAHEFPAEVSPELPQPGQPPVTPHAERVVLEDEALAEALRRQLSAADPHVRRRALRQIPAHLGPRLLSAVWERLGDESWLVRAEACRVLGFLRLEESAPALRQAATDPVWVVRANAAKALAKLGDAGKEALLELLRGPDRYAREVALAALEQSGPLHRNLRRLRSEDPEVRRRAQQFFEALERDGPSLLARALLGTGESTEARAGRSGAA